jgi:spore coat protein CotH
MTTEADLYGDADAALAFCDELLEDVEDLPEAAEDFAADVSEKVESMREWIDANSRCTERMAEALLNMRRGADRWVGR